MQYSSGLYETWTLLTFSIWAFALLTRLVSKKDFIDEMIIPTCQSPSPILKHRKQQLHSQKADAYRR
jgi:hypothetical protein